MKNIRITKEFSLEMAHALHNYDGKCANIHGHSYQFSVTAIGRPSNDENDPKLGMVMDFSVLKKIVNEEVISKFDHALVLKETDPLTETITRGDNFVVKTAYQPTCENLLIDFVERIAKRLPSPVKLHSAALRETATSFASWYAADN